MDTEAHLAHLAAALMAASPSLFDDYIGWATSTLSNVGVAADLVRENLVCLREVVWQDLPEDMAAVVASYIDSALERIAKPPPEAASFLPSQEPGGSLAAGYFRLLLACQRHAAGRLIHGAVESGMAIQDVYLEVFQPCQRELGRLWQEGRITPAQEHYCTAATQLIMSQLSPRLFTAARNGRCAVIACVADETHEVGTRMVADLLELAGWDTIYLGGNVPPRGIVQSLVQHGARLLAASATMMSHLPAMIDLIAAVRAEPACDGVKIMVGGRLFHADGDLWHRIGADGYATDAEQACQLADRLMEGRSDTSIPGAHRDLAISLDATLPDPVQAPSDLYEEMGRVNSEVVALNRELARKNAEVARLHAEVSRQAAGLAEADRRKNEFLAMLGHELRNPLAPLANAIALLGPDDPDVETVRWARDVMGRQVRQMLRLVDDLFDLSRIMQGKLDLRRERVELSSVVAGAVEIAMPIISAKGHELTVALPDEPMVLDADPIRLSQVLTNLLTNAAKYSEPGGRISLTGWRDGAEIVIGVKDSGVGITPEMLPRVFDLFVQDDRSADQSQGGLGVGLAVVKSLVEIHGGSVLAQSEGLGHGSEFLIRLPSHASTGAGGPAPSPKTAQARWARRRILVVDDNVDSAIVMSKMLTRLYGQTVEVAHDGPSALEIAKEFRPEVVLLDIVLPGMDGYEVARRLRREDCCKDSVIIAVSGFGEEKGRDQSNEAGFTHHLVKPLDFDMLFIVMDGQQADRTEKTS